MRNQTQIVVCPDCQVKEYLKPGPNFSYLDMWIQARKKHQDRGCKQKGYAHWGFDPMWDNQEPKTIRSDIKMQLVPHPDGYICTVPAAWDKERVSAYLEATRQRKRRRQL